MKETYLIQKMLESRAPNSFLLVTIVALYLHNQPLPELWSSIELFLEELIFLLKFIDFIISFL